jgi:hypothetical protein
MCALSARPAGSPALTYDATADVLAVWLAPDDGPAVTCVLWPRAGMLAPQALSNFCAALTTVNAP